ncbi:MAG: hypothetical protein CML17_07890 [Pusillimonas sp.]|jgi:hypothetical protein|nr:hypothetical protein [Pusillimonas sp.]|tara:strand:- start:2021 stop:2224 length:204 start_codon:yes stop_codon:yes gene_type:complete
MSLQKRKQDFNPVKEAELVLTKYGYKYDQNRGEARSPSGKRMTLRQFMQQAIRYRPDIKYPTVNELI